MVIVKTWYFEHPCFLDRELYIWDCLGNLIRSPENTTETWAVTDQPLWCIEEPSSVCITVSYPEPPRDSKNLLEGRESTRRPQGRRWLHCACGIQSHAYPLLTHPRLPWEVFAGLLQMSQHMYTWHGPPPYMWNGGKVSLMAWPCLRLMDLHRI